jgi:hypothetical protein
MNPSVPRRWLWLCLPLIAYQFFPNEVGTADTAAIPVVEVAELILRPTPLIGRPIGVLAAVLCLDQTNCMLGDLASPKQTISIDTRRLKAADRQRWARQCFYAPCFEILVGALTGDTFTATASYDTRQPVPSPKPIRPSLWANARNQGTADFDASPSLGTRDLGQKAT